MGYREMFTESEWKWLRCAPLWIGRMVAESDGGMDKEEFRSLSGWVASSASDGSGLIHEVAADIASDLPAALVTALVPWSVAEDGIGYVPRILGGVLGDRRRTAEDEDEVDRFEDDAAEFVSELLMLGMQVAMASGKRRNPFHKKERRALVAVGEKLGFDSATTRQTIAAFAAEARASG